MAIIIVLIVIIIIKCFFFSVTTIEMYQMDEGKAQNSLSESMISVFNTSQEKSFFTINFERSLYHDECASPIHVILKGMILFTCWCVSIQIVYDGSWVSLFALKKISLSFFLFYSDRKICRWRIVVCLCQTRWQCHCLKELIVRWREKHLLNSARPLTKSSPQTFSVWMRAASS